MNISSRASPALNAKSALPHLRDVTVCESSFSMATRKLLSNAARHRAAFLPTGFLRSGIDMTLTRLHSLSSKRRCRVHFKATPAKYQRFLSAMMKSFKNHGKLLCLCCRIHVAQDTCSLLQQRLDELYVHTIILERWRSQLSRPIKWRVHPCIMVQVTATLPARLEKSGVLCALLGCILFCMQENDNTVTTETKTWGT